MSEHYHFGTYSELVGGGELLAVEPVASVDFKRCAAVVVDYLIGGVAEVAGVYFVDDGDFAFHVHFILRRAFLDYFQGCGHVVGVVERAVAFRLGGSGFRAGLGGCEAYAAFGVVHENLPVVVGIAEDADYRAFTGGDEFLGPCGAVAAAHVDACARGVGGVALLGLSAGGELLAGVLELEAVDAHEAAHVVAELLGVAFGGYDGGQVDGEGVDEFGIADAVGLHVLRHLVVAEEGDFLSAGLSYLEKAGVASHAYAGKVDVYFGSVGILRGEFLSAGGPCRDGDGIAVLSEDDNVVIDVAGEVGADDAAFYYHFFFVGSEAHHSVVIVAVLPVGFLDFLYGRVVHAHPFRFGLGDGGIGEVVVACAEGHGAEGCCRDI